MSRTAVLGDDPPQLLALEDGCDFGSALDEHPGDGPDALVALDARDVPPGEHTDFRVVLDLGLEKLSFRDDARVLVVLDYDDPLRVLPVEQ